VIAKEPPSAEIESHKGQPPVKQPDADRIENVRTLFDQRAAYLDRRISGCAGRPLTAWFRESPTPRSWISVAGTDLFKATAKFQMPADVARCVARNAFHGAVSGAGGIVVAGKIRKSGFHAGAI
jgi:hypothetical protein